MELDRICKKLVFATEFGNSLDKIGIWNLTGSEIDLSKSIISFFSLYKIEF